MEYSLFDVSLIHSSGASETTQTLLIHLIKTHSIRMERIKRGKMRARVWKDNREPDRTISSAPAMDGKNSWRSNVRQTLHSCARETPSISHTITIVSSSKR